jgi:phosphoglycolate phosphatase-like HAD superfamily hydrolase
VEELRERGIACAVVASVAAAELLDLLREAAVAGLFDVVVDGGEVDAGRTAPELVQTALSRLHVGPREVVMIGDTRHDIAAAACVNVSTIALRCGGTPERELEGALAIYDHPAALLADIEQSPIIAGREPEDVGPYFIEPKPPPRREPSERRASLGVLSSD